MSAKIGRPRAKPRIPELEETIELLASHGCPLPEIAETLDISQDTLRRSTELFLAWKRGNSRMRNNIRVWQLRSAQKGGAAVLIWLGKTILNQREGDSESTPKIDIQARLRELDELDNDRLEAAK